MTGRRGGPGDRRPAHTTAVGLTEPQLDARATARLSSALPLRLAASRCFCVAIAVRTSWRRLRAATRLCSSTSARRCSDCALLRRADRASGPWCDSSRSDGHRGAMKTCRSSRCGSGCATRLAGTLLVDRPRGDLLRTVLGRALVLRALLDVLVLPRPLAAGLHSTRWHSNSFQRICPNRSTQHGTQGRAR